MNKILMFQQAERSDAKRLGLSLQAFHLLCLLAFSDGQPMRYYANILGITQQALIGKVDWLVEKGYVKRGRNMRNFAVVLLQLTDKGKENISKVLKI